MHSPVKAEGEKRAPNLKYNFVCANVQMQEFVPAQLPKLRMGWNCSYNDEADNDNTRAAANFIHTQEPSDVV